MSHRFKPTCAAQPAVSSLSSRQRSARWHSVGSTWSAHIERIAHDPAQCWPTAPPAAHAVALAVSMHEARSSSSASWTEARWSAQFLGHESSMNFGFRVHSPCDAHPAHCSISPDASVITTVSAHAFAHDVCIKPVLLAHSPARAQPAHSASSCVLMLASSAAAASAASGHKARICIDDVVWRREPSIAGHKCGSKSAAELFLPNYNPSFLRPPQKLSEKIFLFFKCNIFAFPDQPPIPTYPPPNYDKSICVHMNTARY